MPLGPRESFVSSPAPLGFLQKPQAFFAERNSKDGVIRSLFSTGAGKPNGYQAGLLLKELSVVDKELLTLVQKSGTKISVVDPGDSLLDLGAVVPITSEELQKKRPGMKASAQRLLKASENFEQAIKDDKQLAKARNTFIEAGLKGLNEGVAIFQSPANRALSLASASSPDSHISRSLAVSSPATVPLEQLARSRGAQTPEEIKEFTDLVRDLNGDRLKQMDKTARASLQEQLKSGSFMGQAQARQALAQKSETYVNWNDETIVVPDLHYHREPGADPKKPGTRLDSHDLETVNSWGRGEMKTKPFISRTHRDGVTIGGQVIKKTNRILLQQGATDAAVHELGHRFEDILAEKDPEFFAKWTAKRNKMYQQKRASGQSITPYSLEDRGEYLAEGFSYYLKDPKLLKAKDPELFDLTREFFDRLKELAR